MYDEWKTPSVHHLWYGCASGYVGGNLQNLISLVWARSESESVGLLYSRFTERFGMQPSVVNAFKVPVDDCLKALLSMETTEPVSIDGIDCQTASGWVGSGNTILAYSVVRVPDIKEFDAKHKPSPFSFDVVSDFVRRMYRFCKVI